MAENLSLAVQLLIVGMVSVFFILGLVVLLGKTLILIVNKYSEDLVHHIRTETSQISKAKLVVLNTTVELVTEGKGVIKSVKKL